MPKYYWWDGSDIAGLFAEVGRLGSDNVRVRFDPHAGRLHVEPKDGGDSGGGVTTQDHEENGEDGYNFTHTCPPDC